MMNENKKNEMSMPENEITENNNASPYVKMKPKATVLERLQFVQTHIKVGKTNTNNFAHYDYRTIEDIMNCAKPLLAKAKCCLLFSEEIVPVGNHILMKETCSFVSTIDGEKVSTTSYVEIGAPKKGMSIEQQYGAAITYVRRYAASGLLCISNGDADFDAMPANGAQTQAPHNQGNGYGNSNGNAYYR